LYYWGESRLLDNKNYRKIIKLILSTNPNIQLSLSQIILNIVLEKYTGEHFDMIEQEKEGL